MLKICYNTCCGIDVHKKMLVATIATTDERKVTTYQTKQFSIIVSFIALHFGHSVFPLFTKFIQCQTGATFFVPEFQFLLVKTVPQNPQ